MINKIKKYISNNTGFLIRLDDIAENMHWEMMKKVTDLFDKYQVNPVLGVVPNNKDPHLLSYPKTDKNFWDQVRSWKERGWVIAMHGNSHVYDKVCSKIDYLNLGGNTEFCDHNLEIQLDKIKSGINKFERESIKIKTFFAPNHTFDKNTLLALKKSGINEIIDGYGLMPYEENEITFIPQLFYKNFTLPFGIQTLQIHLNYFKNEDFSDFEKFIKLNAKKIITYEQALNKVKNNFSYKFIRIVIKKILQLKRIN